ncbi:MAG: DUF3108 domain-containing protein [Lysobacter sp.]|nr:DUF3108 domain-containing protein [Lysobacter sp.]
MDFSGILAPSWRPAAVAVAVSALVHATALVGLQVPDAGEASLDAPPLEATLVPAPEALPAPVAAPPPKPRARPRPRPPRADETVATLPAAIEEAALAPLEADAALPPEGEPLPEMVALAQPSVPAAPAELPRFDRDAFPAEVSIAYSLTSAFADGVAEYTWKRDGDRYEITGFAEAVGFFTLFLEGQINQSTSGHVTAEGLRPDRFTERRGTTPEEGLSFDWDARQVEFRRGDDLRTAPLADATVDWLSMIFQLAHMPPKGDTMDLRVYTQRRLYQYRLQVVGFEDLELPFGNARTLHLRHAGQKPEEVVDVWLGVDQHYLPVKLRYPVARNRLVVEQTATSVRAR